MPNDTRIVIVSESFAMKCVSSTKLQEDSATKMDVLVMKE